MDLIWGQSDIFITCLSTSAFYKVFHNDQTAQCGIHHMYTVVSQKNATYVNYTVIVHKMKS